MGEPNHLMISRLRKEMQRLGLNARELSDRANVGRSFVYDILSGKSANPTTQKISAVADVLGVSVPYLIAGTSNDNVIEGQGEGVYAAIPEITLSRNPDGSYRIDQEPKGNSHYFMASWIKNTLQATPNQLRVALIHGDIMYPTLQDSDVVLINITRKRPTPPGIFALFDGIGLVPKRLEYINHSQESRIFVAPDNRQYASYERNMEDLDIVGRIVWFSRQL